jgi:hypothetical protein
MIMGLTTNEYIILAILKLAPYIEVEIRLIINNYNSCF